ncbi:MAG: hypothetical protein O2856_09930, partial [Planctomycetota bacterium]|nr:hypothetical protein [Planctomycetota bacterium]
MNAPMVKAGERVAFISSLAGAPWGGSEILWSETAIALKNRGIPVFASVFGWPTTPVPVVKLRTAAIEVYERPHSVVSYANRLKKILVGKRHKDMPDAASLECMRRLQRFEPTLVCISNGNPVNGLQWMEMCRERNLSYVVVAQAAMEAVWPNDNHADRLIQAYRSAVASFFVSDRNRRLFESQLGASLPNAEIVRNPYQVKFNAAATWNENTSPWQLACVARLEPMAKGQDLLLEVLSGEAWKAREWHLNFYG